VHAVPVVDEERDSFAESLGDLLGVDEAAFDTTDPVALGRAFTSALARAAIRPWSVGPAWVRYGAGMCLAGAGLGSRLVGIRLPDAAAVDPRDTRFRSPAWSDNPFFHALLESYLLTERLLHELVHAAHLEGPAAPKAAFAAQLVADAAAPTNFLLTNPAALVRAFETAGGSVLRGARNFVHDVVENHGWPSQVDRDAFRVGENLAVTPGKVVYRNELIELLQYEPQTDEVYEIPLVVCPPWINRYYIADLAPEKSLVEWAVQRGHTVFAVSYRNPDESMRDLTFDDYLRLGPLSAIDVARSIGESDTVNTLAICLGGTMNAMALAYLDACGDRLVNSSTYLNSTIDYEGAGALASVFADPETVEGLVRRMEKSGYLDGRDMARTFDLLRANDLVFRYVVDGWLLGETPPAFDLLAWNADSTNMPGKAHAHFIRKMYLENALAHDQYVAMGEQLLVSEIATDSYIVAAIEDHIVPWRVSYRSTQLLKGAVRFVLTSAGHIAGIVNPPSPRARLWTNDDLPPDADEWRAGATEHHDTWWNDWAGWIATRSGTTRVPPPAGNASYPVLGDAPGTYVRT
jgi:polyhydroxyalkanoate synthase